MVTDPGAPKLGLLTKFLYGTGSIGYGVKDEHYEIVGGALLWTLGQGLGDAFTPEVEEAWAEAYGLLATVMKEAAAEAA